MATLAIVQQDLTETDLNSVSETVRRYSATIDGKPVRLVWTVPTTANDTTERTAYKAELTTLGYEWTAEA